jgi:hypothetical protein
MSLSKFTHEFTFLNTGNKPPTPMEAWYINFLRFIGQSFDDDLKILQSAYSIWLIQ